MLARRPAITSGTQIAAATPNEAIHARGRRVLAPALGIGDDEEHAQAGGDGDRRQHLAAADGLAEDARAEREREHDGRGEQGLDDDDPPDPQRGGLGGVADPVGGHPGQPHGTSREAQEEAGLLGVLVRDLLRLLLLEDGPEREQQCGDEGERDLQHGSDTNPRPGAPTTA